MTDLVLIYNRKSSFFEDPDHGRIIFEEIGVNLLYSPLPGDSEDGIHVRTPAEEMNGDDRLEAIPLLDCHL